MKLMVPKVLKLVSAMVDDVFLLIGIALVSYGGFLIYRPTGFIVLGFCFWGMAFLFAKRFGR